MENYITFVDEELLFDRIRGAILSNHGITAGTQPSWIDFMNQLRQSREEVAETQTSSVTEEEIIEMLSSSLRLSASRKEKFRSWVEKKVEFMTLELIQQLFDDIRQIIESHQGISSESQRNWLAFIAGVGTELGYVEARHDEGSFRFTFSANQMCSV